MKLEDKIEESFTVTLTRSEIIQLVRRLKYKLEYVPDLSKPTWQELEKLVGPVDNPPDLY